MKESNLFELFPPEYRNLILHYKNTLPQLLEQYDVAIFMARKAICFYKSLCIGGYISKPENCEVFSSRILTYNVYERLVGKKVLLIDDVVIQGDSVSNDLKTLSDNGINADLYIMARQKIEIEEDKLKNENIIDKFAELSKEDILQLSKYIAHFIEASMCPYNVDQPIYSFLFSNDEMIEEFVEKYNLIDTASSLKNRNDIKSYVVEIPKKFFSHSILENVVELCKIRFFRGKYNGENVFLAIPFVLLGEMTNDDLELVFSDYRTKQIEQFIYNKNEKIIRENQLKIIHYVLSSQLIETFIRSSEVDEIHRLHSNDEYVFSKNILQMVDRLENPFDFVYEDLFQTTVNYCEFNQSEYLSLAYDFLYTESRMKYNYYTNSSGKFISSDLLILSNLKKFIEERINGEFNNFIFSDIIDALIDKGMIIPSIIHGNSSIIRAYKCGEVYTLGEEEFKLFAYTLQKYLEQLKRDKLEKTEFEKLCVLFFREATQSGIFSYSEASGREDEYSICYSKFGPRISTSKPIYNADENSTLASKLITLNLIELDAGVYKVEKINPIEIKNQSWSDNAEVFADKYEMLYKNLFTRKIVEGEEVDEILFDEVRDMHLISYTEFLTMLAIGLDKKEQLLSLLAELHLVDFETSGNIGEVLNQYFRITDGLVSGMWKYMCYEHSEHPLRKLNKKLRSDEKTRLLSTSIANTFKYNRDTDQNEHIAPMIEEAGKLIFSIVYCLWYMSKKYDVRFKSGRKHINLEIRKKREFYYKNLETFRHSIRDQVDANDTIQNLKTLEELKSDASRLIKQYHSEIASGKKQKS